MPEFIDLCNLCDDLCDSCDEDGCKQDFDHCDKDEDGWEQDYCEEVYEHSCESIMTLLN